MEWYCIPLLFDNHRKSFIQYIRKVFLINQIKPFLQISYFPHYIDMIYNRIAHLLSKQEKEADESDDALIEND